MSIVAFKKPDFGRIACTRCGAWTDASCNCGEPYVPPNRRAAEALASNPDKSDRAIAAEIGVNPMTVGRMRKQLEGILPRDRVGVTDVTPATIGRVIGKDGKLYTRRRKPPKTADDLNDQAQKYTREIFTFLEEFCPRVKRWHAAHPELSKKDRAAAVSQLYQCAEWVQRLAQAIDGRDPEAAWSEE